MNLDLQILIDIVGNMLISAFPISLVLCITSKLCNFVTSMIFGKRVDL